MCTATNIYLNPLLFFYLYENKIGIVIYARVSVWIIIGYPSTDSKTIILGDAVSKPTIESGVIILILH